MASRCVCVIFCVAIFFGLCTVTPAQESAAADRSATSTTLSADYPSDRAGVLIRDSDWLSIGSEGPSKSHVKHSLAPAFTYGLAPAVIVSDYNGLHAQVHVQSRRPVICLCHFNGLPGEPVLVKLHVKKGMRELDGGKLHIGAKLAEAEKSDLITVNVSKPDETVWLIQPEEPLPPGEYALMLGTQNIVIFPFTVDADGASAASGKR